MFLVKWIVGLRVLYIYSFAFNFVELEECTRIRGVVSVLISDVGVESRHGELVRQSACGNLAASMESHGERVWKPGSFHGAPWIAQFGYAVGGESRQLATDAVVCTASQCHDSR